MNSPSTTPNTLNLCRLSALPLNWPQWPALNPLSILKTCSGSVLLPSSIFFHQFLSAFLQLQILRIWLQKFYFSFCLFFGVCLFAHKKPMVNVCYRTTSGSCHVPVMRLCLWFHPLAGSFWTTGPVMCCLNHVIILGGKQVSKLL